ncbi:hypothetical protein FPY71_07085 [Aureimonas fodinaquatilis]|uniref:ERF family protein n=1 Tax=Aureimonas fodinaquatilis TaxID=2565783 RepID=A0A5B0DV28_9HYPH|nr:ERF family protein [Aureimonas fodinaquatilis]KAA0970283.1 hypothetical protein FPY71_07085 [Aureimonas fodinaquatilis]
MSIVTSPTINKLMTSLLAFQGKVEGVHKDSKNPHFKNSYASLEAVVEAARPHLQENGIVFNQAPGIVVDGCIEVTTRLTHAESGEWMQSTMHVPMSKRDPQGAGSAMTYGLRYSLMAALGLPPLDDDAESAIDRNQQRPKPTARVNDRNAVIADTMIEAMKISPDQLALEKWWMKQKSEIEDLDEVSRNRVLNTARDLRKSLPKASTLEAG